MPTLDWIGKQAVVNHHLEVPYHLLRDVPELGCGPADSGNLIVEGDNLTALKALLPYYAGQVKCIYIDPPYNTGNEGWVYNDNVNSPEINAWLGKVVGKEAEDLSRHDKWLCMMYPRLKLLSQFLAEDGAMFVSIDDTELPALRLLMDEFFPHPEGKNRLACFVWETDGNFDNQAKIKLNHEYVLGYSKRFEKFPAPPIIDPSIPKTSKLFKKEIQNTVVKNGIKNPPSDVVLPVGFPANFAEGTIVARDDKWPKFSKDLIIKDGRLSCDSTVNSGWSAKEILLEFIRNKFEPVLDSKGQKTKFFLTATGAIEYAKVRTADQSHVISVIRDVGSTQSTSEALAEMGIDFDYPKPVGLVKYLVSMVSDRSALVLDAFAGSGTTGQAVLELNKESGNRRFILIQMPVETVEQQEKGTNLCRDLTRFRIKAASEGYTTKKAGHIEGLGGSFRYVQLGDPIFDATGKIRSTVRFRDLARHVFFTETGTPLPKDAPCDKPLLGVAHGTGVYLLYNGILKDKSVDGGNVLTQPILDSLPKHDGPKVIYAASNRVSPARLKAHGITFKQTPYAIKVR